MMKKLIAVAIGACVLIGAGTGRAAMILTTGQTVTGTTKDIVLTAGSISPNTAAVTLSNSGSDLVVSFKSDSPNGDFYMQWDGAGDGLNFNTVGYDYLQIDIASVSAGMVTSGWQLYWQDDDSTIGGATNSGQTVGNVTPQAGAFSVVIDLTEGGTKVSGALGWGDGTTVNTLDKFRIDPFQSIANAGESFTISRIFFGTELTPTPEPASLALVGLGGMMILRCRRRA